MIMLLTIMLTKRRERVPSLRLGSPGEFQRNYVLTVADFFLSLFFPFVTLWMYSEWLHSHKLIWADFSGITQNYQELHKILNNPWIILWLSISISLFLYFSLSSSSPFHRSASNKVDDGNKSVKNPYESTSEAKKSNTEAKLGVAVRDLRGGD